MKLTPEQLAADENTSPLELIKLTKQSIELARIVVSNPSATPEILAEISISKDIILLQNLTANVNTPPEVLQRLANISIDQLLAHTINDWEQAKRRTNLDPFGNGTVKLEAHCQRLADIGISPEVTNGIKEACKIYQHIARNPNTSVDCLLSIGFLFPEKFLKNPILPLLILENPDFIDKNYYLQIELAKHPKTPVNILKYLVEYGRYGVRKHIAQYSNTPMEWLIEWLEEEKINDAIKHQIGLYEALKGIANNPHTSEIALERLAEISFLRSIVAANPNTLIKVLENLSNSDSSWVRQKVALNPNLSIAIFQKLVNNEDEQVRHNLARNPSVPKHLLRKLINKQQKLK